MPKVIKKSAQKSLYPTHAMLKGSSNIVVSMVDVPNSFSMAGYIFVSIPKGAKCDVGMHYDIYSSLFYDDAAFTKIGGVSVAQVDSSGGTEAA